MVYCLSRNSPMETAVPIPSLPRERLVAFAYRMLGSRHDAEDVVQEAYSRLHERDVAADDPARYAFRVVANLCVDRLRAEQVRRRTYFGPWLPEPWLEESSPVDVAELAEDLSVALLLLLERLSPGERVVFVLREAFDLKFDEIADVIGVTAAACRQRYARAKSHMKDAPRKPAPVDAQRNLLTRLVTAITEGSVANIVQLLSTDAVLISDGGGEVTAAIRPVHGVERIATVLAHTGQKALKEGALDVRFNNVNGGWGLTLLQHGKPHSCMTIAVDGDRIEAIFIMRNPKKLQPLERI
jgi:RNA polymerase sigma-70 factor (ECF subfamily)